MSDTTTKRLRPMLGTRDIAANIPGGLESTARVWLASGRIPSVKRGRCLMARRQDVAAFLGVEPHELITAD